MRQLWSSLFGGKKTESSDLSDSVVDLLCEKIISGDVIEGESNEMRESLTGIMDGHLVPKRSQMIGGGKTGRTRSNDENVLAGGRCRRFELPSLPDRLVT